jgi:galactokinase
VAESPLEAVRRLFARFGARPGAVAEAPGRVNLIGEHTDYNGGLVLPAALERRTVVAVRVSGSPGVRGISREEGEAEAALDDPPQRTWLDYVRGVALEVDRSFGPSGKGLEVAVASEVPCGSGLSSSAALGVATALALGRARGSPFGPGEGLRVARLCQRAENDFVGVPCGLLDPLASIEARAGHATLLDCARLIWEAVPLPPGVELLIVDTGVRRALRDGSYAERRGECEQALRAAQRLLGRPLESLSEIALSELGALGRDLPGRLARRVRHVVTENERVRQLAAALRGGELRAAGEALYASHESLRCDYEVTCAESDHLVELSRSVEGLLGARMTGAGWGGCTVHLFESGRAELGRERLGEGFAARFGHRPIAWSTRAGRGARVIDQGTSD